MKIINLDQTVDNERARVSATTEWEDCDRGSQLIYFETDLRYSGELNADPHAFLLASLMPAIHGGEKRLKIDGEICPQLHNGLIAAVRKFNHVHGTDIDNTIQIEATKGFKPRISQSLQRTASFLSGGVDSLSTLRNNRLDFPIGHAYSIQDGIIVHGFDIGGPEAVEAKTKDFKQVVSSLSTISEDAGIHLIPIHTNLRQLEDRRVFFPIESCGTALSAVAHSLSKRISTVLVASSANIFDDGLAASHALLNPGYCSSAEMHVSYDGERYERIEKVGLIAEWDIALQNLRVCNDPFLPDGVMNCGHCAKCILTMTELLVHKKLINCSAFPVDDISAEMIDSLHEGPVTNPNLTSQEALSESARLIGPGDISFWRELISPLNSLGRKDLAVAINAKMNKCENYWNRAMGKNWKAALKRFDSRCLGGAMFGLYQMTKREK